MDNQYYELTRECFTSTSNKPARLQGVHGLFTVPSSQCIHLILDLHSSSGLHAATLCCSSPFDLILTRKVQALSPVSSLRQQTQHNVNISDKHTTNILINFSSQHSKQNIFHQIVSDRGTLYFGQKIREVGLCGLM